MKVEMAFIWIFGMAGVLRKIVNRLDLQVCFLYSPRIIFGVCP